MNLQETDFLYITLILPSLFGLTLVGEGLNRILKSELTGLVSLVFGILFIVIVILAYLFLSGRMNI